MTRKFLLFLATLMACACFWTHKGEAAEWQPGFRTIGAWTEDAGLRMDINLWYPATRQARDVGFPPWTIIAAQNAKCADGLFPLLILSHPTPGTRFSYHDLAAFFAKRGFVVGAPTHSHDNMNNMDDLLTWRQMERRAQEITESVRQIISNPDIGPHVDKNRIGLVGFGAGGTSALLLGGALPNCSSWPAYCAKADKDDTYCGIWAKEKIDEICQKFPLDKSMANPVIKAIAVIAPNYGMFFNAESFKYFYPPALLVEAGLDRINKPELHCEPIARILGPKASYLDLSDADTGALMSRCPQSMASEMPELCLSVSARTRSALRRNLELALYSFFAGYLLDPARLPVIPNPPSLEQPPENKQDIIQIKKSGRRGKNESPPPRPAIRPHSR